MIRIGEFSFDPATGELERGGSRTRLTPQTSLLLQALLEADGKVVSRAEIQARIWPDTTVDFDQGLSFCVRQLRLALGDDASEPRYVETLPKRGYRLVADVERDSLAAPPPEATPQRAGRRAWLLGAGTVALLAAIGAWYARSASPAPILAIVPFDAPGDSGRLIEYRDRLADALVTGTTQRSLGRVRVEGPSFTIGFDSRTPIDSIAGRTGAAYALSGVVRSTGMGIEVFAQLIRARDRAHVWVVRHVDSAANPGGVGAWMADSVSRVMRGASR